VVDDRTLERDAVAAYSGTWWGTARVYGSRTGRDGNGGSYLAGFWDRGSGIALATVDCCIVTVSLRSEEHTSELQSRFALVCRLLLVEKNSTNMKASW